MGSESSKTLARPPTTKQSQDCPQPVCKDDEQEEYRKHYQARKNKAKSQNNNDDTSAEKILECPLTKGVLGYYSWSLLHTFAAYYPQNPTTQQQQKMKGFLEGFKQLYPCSHCRPHFVKDYDRDPPTLQSRVDLSLWVCRQHNYVNKLLGKQQFDCNFESLMKRWRHGCSDTQEEL